MPGTIETYRRAAIILWGAVSLVAGLSIGIYFNMDSRKIIFVVVAAVGLYILWLLRRSSRKTEEEKVVDMNREENQDVFGFGAGEEQGEILESSDEESAEDESQRWLDEFIVEQQRDLEGK